MAQMTGTIRIHSVLVVTILSDSSLTEETVSLNIAPDEPTSRVDTHCGQFVGIRSRIQSY
jgi:hypothetical protein